MEKEFVPYELAVKLKALGFDEPCFGRWWFRADMHKLNEEELEIIRSNYFELPEHSILAPTFSQAFRWFREKHGLQGYVYSTTVRGGKEGKHFSDYCWHINGIDMPFLSTDARDMENVSYEEVELACLEKLIKIVK